MSLRIPLSPDQTLQTEFHEIERRLRKLEKRTGTTAGNTTIQVLGGGSSGAPNLTSILNRLDALEAAVAAIPDPEDVDIPVFGGVGPSSSTGIVPAPGVPLPPAGIAQHLLTEDAEWGFPLRGLVSVATSGEQTVPPHDVVDIAAGLHVAGPIVAPTIDGGNYVSPVVVGDDGYIYRDAAGALAQRNGATGQTFRIYNTYTDATNWERFSLGWTSNVTRITTEQQGSGTSRVLRLGSTGTASMYLMSNNVDKWVLDQFGQFYPGADASYPIGTSSIRVRGIFLGGAAGYVPITVKAHASQTANLTEWQNSSGTALSRIKSNGRWRHNGATTWNDLRIEPVARTTGANAPSFEKYFDDAAGTSRGVYLYSFDDAAGGSEKEVFFTMQMPHDWAEGTAIHLHCHWVGSVSDTTSAPRWGLEYAWKDVGQTFGDTVIVYTDGVNIDGAGSTDANITAGKHYISEFAAITPGTDANNISSIIIGRLFRDSAAAEDTYNAATNKCGLLYIDAHFEVDSLGSDTELAKD